MCRAGASPDAGAHDPTTSPRGRPMIQVQHLSRRFGSTQALDDLSFEVRPGVVTGFLGPNGAGKSTAMRTRVGLTTPSSGRVLIDGRGYGELRRPLRVVGTVLDGNGFHPA